MRKNNDIINFFITDNKSGWKTKPNTLKKREPELYSEIIKYGDKNNLDVPFKVLVWHYINDVPTIPECGECGVDLKFKKSLKEGYGKYCSISCTNKNIEHISKQKNTWNNNKGEILKKMKQTNIERYGVDNTFKRLDMVKNGFIKKHGVDHVSKVDGVRDKINETNNKKYGVDNVLLLGVNRDKSYNTISDKFNLKYEHLDINKIDGKNISISCDKGHDYVINRNLLYYRDKLGINPCTVCNPMNSKDSYHENEISDFISNLGFDVIKNDREILKPKEIDVYVNTLKIGVEFNGVYWHSDKFVDKNYHINKTNKANSLGVELIQVFQDEWVNKKDIVKSILKNRLNVNDDIIYARKCVIKEIKPSISREFLNKNHIQGNVNASVKIGLYHNDELISVMTFGKNRRSLGQRHVEGEWEMLRFCNKLNTSVVGGASKLYKFFVKNYKPKKITSYSDNRYFNGGVYEKLGFTYIKHTKPNYFYVIKTERKNRFNYRKDVLVKEGYDKNKTEKQIMEERGYNRIYDCGNKKWVMLFD